MANSNLPNCENCSRLILSLWFSVAHAGAFVCCWCIHLDALTPQSRAEVEAQRSETPAEIKKAA
jgi:hypothetical protein